MVGVVEKHCVHLSSNGDLDLDAGLDVDDDLLDDLGGGSQTVWERVLASALSSVSPSPFSRSPSAGR